MDWNVIVTAQERGFKQARELLREFGKVNKSEFFNVLLLQVDDIERFLQDMSAAIAVNKDILQVIGRIVPVTHTFVYQSPQQFEEHAQELVAEWIPLILGKRFHVRMHRRGFKGRLSSQHEEMFLDHFIIDSAAKAHQSVPVIDFEEPDFIIAVETIGQRAGLSLWTQQQLHRYPFLKMD
ncbi:MAG: THUMP domain-containing protein [Gammaproteobacteria bacterium]|jgi:tRNA(Ser,Leu) C12 N-acetylase TAN1